MSARDERRDLALAVWGGFCRCPTTGRIIEFAPGDDKALCGCGQSNPRAPIERNEQTGTHVVRFLDSATVDEYLDQFEQQHGSTVEAIDDDDDLPFSQHRH